MAAKHSSKPKLAAVATAIERPELNGEVYTIQGLADGAHAIIERFYEAHYGDNTHGACVELLHAMRILDMVDERLDSLGARIGTGREAANG